MAYTKDLKHTCEKCRRKSAQVEVYTHRNESIGKYCRPCGKSKIRHLKELERQEFGTDSDGKKD